MKPRKTAPLALLLLLALSLQILTSCGGSAPPEATDPVQTGPATQPAENTEKPEEKTDMLPKLDHFYIDRAFDKGEKTNTEMTDEGLSLVAGATEGTYLSEEIPAANLHSLCGSFSGWTATDATVELAVSLKVGGTYTKYFSYGEWGFGRRNRCVGQTDTKAEMDLDEILVTGSALAEGCRVRLTLRRDSADLDSPTVRLYSLALELRNYTYAVDASDLPREVKYDVPEYAQGRVPEIGGSICSPSTSSMLLAFRGFDVEKDENNAWFPAYSGYTKSTLSYPNGSFAALCNDYGNGIFGNWSYNVMCMGAYGANACVKRFYSLEEVLESLAEVGPMGVSTRGYIVHSGRSWNSQGHLMVLTGYRINDDGSRVLYMNDPSFGGVACEITEENFAKINRMVMYVIE